MSLVFDYDFTSSHSNPSFNIVSSNSKLQNQINNLSESLKKYDISSERKQFLIERAMNISTLVFMNMNYLASSLIIMDRFDENGKETTDDTVNLQIYLSKLFSSSDFTRKYFDKFVNAKNEESKTNYLVYSKRIIFSYCLKILSLKLI